MVVLVVEVDVVVVATTGIVEIVLADVAKEATEDFVDDCLMLLLVCFFVEVDVFFVLDVTFFVVVVNFLVGVVRLEDVVLVVDFVVAEGATGALLETALPGQLTT